MNLKFTGVKQGCPLSAFVSLAYADDITVIVKIKLKSKSKLISTKNIGGHF